MVRGWKMEAWPESKKANTTPNQMAIWRTSANSNDNDQFTVKTPGNYAGCGFPNKPHLGGIQPSGMIAAKLS